MRKVIVVGAGPAGLAAAESLLHRGKGKVDVTVLTLEPYLGGSAASFTTSDGRVVEQGQHIMAGFYRELGRLLKRAGVPKEETTVSNRGHMRVWEDRDQQTHDLHFGASSVGALFDGLRYSWGFGFRWFSPIGPLRFEWGLPFEPEDGEEPLVFEFTIGNFF